MLSDYCKKIMDMLNVSVSETKKLSPDLLDTEHLCLELQNLATVCEVGDEVEKDTKSFQVDEQ